MIQRIQSVYLIFTLLLCGLSFYFTLGKPYPMIINVGFNPSYCFLAEAIITFMTFLLFKKRILQAKLCFLNILLLILMFFVYITSLNFSKSFGFNESVSILSIISIVLLWLARRAILKDEALVRAVDRIR